MKFIKFGSVCFTWFVAEVSNLRKSFLCSLCLLSLSNDLNLIQRDLLWELFHMLGQTLNIKVLTERKREVYKQTFVRASMKWGECILSFVFTFITSKQKNFIWFICVKIAKHMKWLHLTKITCSRTPPAGIFAPLPEFSLSELCVKHLLLLWCPNAGHYWPRACRATSEPGCPL